MFAFKNYFGTGLNSQQRLRYHKAKHKKKLTDETTPSRLQSRLKVDIEHPLKLKINNQTYVYKH